MKQFIKSKKIPKLIQKKKRKKILHRPIASKEIQNLKDQQFKIATKRRKYLGIKFKQGGERLLY